MAHHYTSSQSMTSTSVTALLILRGRILRMMIGLVPFFVLACSQSEAPEQAQDALPIRADFDRSAPLSQEEVTRFLTTVKQLPNQSIPEFTPLAEFPSPGSLSASEHVRALRKKLDRQLDPRLQASAWRGDPRLMQSLERAGYTPEDFADVLVRISCAYSSLALSKELNLPKIQTKADAELSRTIGQLEALQALETPLTPEQHASKSKLETLLLQNVGLAHFAELLSSVPPESLHVVNQYHGHLKQLLPESPIPNELKKSREFFSEIVPASYEK